MPVYFRCDGGSRIGLGHLVRSMALAQMLQADFQLHFLIQNPDAGTVDLLQGEQLAFTALPETNDYAAEARFIRDHIIVPGDLVVLDGYLFDTQYQETLVQKQVILVCIDDLQAFPFVADLIINQAGGVNPDRYQALPHTQLCLGPGYALLRAPFLQAARKDRTLKPITLVLLNMGGADPRNDTCSLLAELLQLAPETQVEVVTGSAFRFGEALSGLAAKHSRVRLHQNLTAEKMCQLMQACDAAILPPSSVSYEWCSVGGPLFLFQTADNQAAMKSFLLQEELADTWENFNAYRQQTNMAGHLARQQQQQRKYFNGQSLKNLRRVFNQLYYGRYLELSFAGHQDVMTLYDWANDPAVRENSFSQAPIPLEVHKIWFENKLKEESCQFLVARVKGMAAGMIRYDLKQNQGVISYLIDRNFRGKSLGTIILLKGEALLKKHHPEVSTIIGHVQETNQASVASFRNAGYIPSQTVSSIKPGAMVFEKKVITVIS